MFLSPAFKGLAGRPTRRASCRFFVIPRCRHLLPSLRPVPQLVAITAVLRCHKGRFTTRNGLFRTAIRPLWDACWAASGGFALPCRVFSSPAAAFRPGCLATSFRPPAHCPGMLAHGGRLQPRGALRLRCRNRGPKRTKLPVFVRLSCLYRVVFGNFVPLNAFVAPRGSMARMVAEGDSD